MVVIHTSTEDVHRIVFLVVVFLVVVFLVVSTYLLKIVEILNLNLNLNFKSHKSLCVKSRNLLKFT